MSDQYRVLCAGHVNWDVVLHTDSIPDPDCSADLSNEHATCGGSSTNTARALASLDVKATLLGSIGDDGHADRIERELAATPVRSALARGDVPTTVIYALITENADPRYFARHATFEPVGVDDLTADEWDALDHVHLTTWSNELATALSTAAAADGKTVSFNPTQGYADESFPEVVDAADIIFLNEREADIFRDRHDFAAVITETCVIITNGAAGATVYGPNGVVAHPGFNLGSDQLADTVGAGDAFVGGFLAAWLADHTTRDAYETAVAQANACGAYAVTTVGSPGALDADWVRRTV
jgi:ribokinase